MWMCGVCCVWCDGGGVWGARVRDGDGGRARARERGVGIDVG